MKFGSNLEERGREAARSLWDEGLKAKIEDPFEPAFAQAAIREFGQLQRDHTPGILSEVLEGAEMSAEQLNVGEYQGVMEVIQNADDVGATVLRIALRTQAAKQQLLFVHDGDPIGLRELVAMALAFVSTKRENVDAKGRFGIGLKTLSRLGSSLTVHCDPYHASIEGNHISPASAAAPIENFYQPDAGETLLELELNSDFEPLDFKQWLADWDSSELLFLAGVRKLEFIGLRPHESLPAIGLDECCSKNYELHVGSQRLACTETLLRDMAGDRSWRRYAVEQPVSAKAPRRRHKATGKTTPLAIAIAEGPVDKGRLYAGLQLQVSMGVPFNLNAQFNVDTPRTGVQHDSWNNWLLERSIELATAVALQRFEVQSADGWAAVPLIEETHSVSEAWLRGRLEAGCEAIRRQVAQSVAFEINGTKRSIGDLVYEAEPLEHLLDDTDLHLLYPDLAPLQWEMRDRFSRWRSVIADLGVGKEVTANDALRLLDGNTADGRPVSWFIRFAHAALTAKEGDNLWWRRSIVLADDRRIVPPHPEIEGEVLLQHAQPASLATQLGLARVIHPEYLSTNPETTAVRRWLEESEILVEGIGDEQTMRALAARGNDGTGVPIVLADEQLIALRNALSLLSDDDQAALGHNIGKAITVRGFTWDRGKRMRIQVAPAKAYLPATLEDRTDGWAKAAGKAEGLAWVEPGYSQILRRPKGDRRTPAALAFFRLLGAEVAPRLERPQYFDTRHGDEASPIQLETLTFSQREALADTYVTHLKREALSPDLACVVNDLAREQVGRPLRGRAQALLAVLDREWQRLYEGHETAIAVYSSYTWHHAKQLPATWRGVAMDTPWLLSEDQVLKPPKDLVVRTPMREALYGHDPLLFAADIDPGLANSPAIRGLGIGTDPSVSELVECLLEMRDGHADPVKIALCYSAIASAVPNVDATADQKVGDLTVRQLRASFGVGQRRSGLLLVEGCWLPPQKVLRGKPIFGKYRSFVPEKSGADRLWQVLGVRAPTVSDCIDVLRELESRAPGGDEEQILLDTYVYLRDNLANAMRTEQRALAQLPLWSGERWLPGRPVYLVDDPQVGRELEGKIAIWRPPLTADALQHLIPAFDVTLLDDSSFHARVGPAELLAGEVLKETFASAVGHLREWLARRDPGLYDMLGVGWEELADAAIALAPNLHIELRLPRRRPLSVSSRAHVMRQPLQFAVDSEEALGAVDAGGRAVATLFQGGDRDKAALAWADSWKKAFAGEYSSGIRLAEASEEESEDPLELLSVQASMATKRKARQSQQKQQSKAVAHAETMSSQTTLVRRLKGDDDLGDVVSVSRPDGRTPRLVLGSSGLRSDTPPGMKISYSNRPAPKSAPRAYSPQQQEHLALVALHRAINGELSGLKDFRHLRGIGADALDELKRAFEIKSFATAMPDRVVLTANEFQRALQDGNKYHLAVVAGLEEGYETIVRIIANPVQSLALQRSGSFVLTGVLSVEKPLEVRFAVGSDYEAAPQDTHS